MTRSMSNSGFKVMAFLFKIRDLFSPRSKVLEELVMKPGFHVLDFGCGPGGYILPTVDLVGRFGMVYALDIHPLALEEVEKIARKRGLENVKTIHSSCKTGLDDNSLDVVLIYDVFHLLEQPYNVLKELHRVLKEGEVMSFSDHHMNEKDILDVVTETGLFKLTSKGKKTYTFKRV